MGKWQNPQTIGSKKYTCFFCDSLVASDKGYGHTSGKNYIYICPHCDNATYFNMDPLGRLIQNPAPLFGNPVDSVPPEVADLYKEARVCTGANAFTAAVLVCRKILMHIAVQKGDKKGKGFLEYVDYLSAKGYVPPNGNNGSITLDKRGMRQTMKSF